MEILPVADYSPYWESIPDELNNVRGDVAEFGVYNGGSTRILSQLFPDRTVWAFDTYSGIPRADHIPEIDRDSPGNFACQFSPAEMFDSYPNVIPVKGRFKDTLRSLPYRPMLAFAYLDCDLYHSAMDVFEWIYKHLSRGAIVWLDDYKTHPGIQKAADEFIETWGVKFDGQYRITWAPRPGQSALQAARQAGVFR